MLSKIKKNIFISRTIKCFNLSLKYSDDSTLWRGGGRSFQHLQSLKIKLPLNAAVLCEGILNMSNEALVRWDELSSEVHRIWL